MGSRLVDDVKKRKEKQLFSYSAERDSSFSTTVDSTKDYESINKYDDIFFSYSVWRDLSFSDIRDRSSDYGSKDKYNDKFFSYGSITFLEKPDYLRIV